MVSSSFDELGTSRSLHLTMWLSLCRLRSLSCKLFHRWMLTDSLNKELNLQLEHFKFFSALLTDLLLLLLQLFSNDLLKLALRCNNEVMQLPVRGVLVTRDSCIDPVVKQLLWDLHVHALVWLLLWKEVHDHVLRSVRSL